MTDLMIPLTDAEREFLVNHLEAVLKDTRVEEHRTRSPKYREGIIAREEIIVAILNKIRAKPAVVPS